MNGSSSWRSGEAAFVEGDHFLQAAFELIRLGGGFAHTVAQMVFEELRFQPA